MKRRLTMAGLAAALATGAAAALVLVAPAASAATASFVRVSSWSTGYEARFTVTNNTSSTINGWNVQFDLPAGSSMGTYWDALVSTSGQHVTATNRSWNGTLAPNASTSFGFIVTGTGDPANCTANGASCSGGGTPPTVAPTTRPPTTPPTTPPPGNVTRMSAPYLYLDWGNPPSATAVMQATGIRQFTMAFMLSGGGCTPAWDGNRPLTGGADQQTINAIRAAGGDIQISFGGWSGNKLGPNCATPQALAGAYQQVINAYNLRYIDIDIENSDEFENEVVQDRILNALKIVKQNNPGITTIVTFGTSQTGPNYWGNRLITRAAALQANIDNFTIMPFDFGCTSNMATCTQSAAEGLKNALKSAFGWSDAQAYAHMGISGMNGLSDQQELTTPAMWTQIRDYAKARGIARFATWSVNRDRGCPGGGVQAACSGIAQSDWEFTRIMAAF